VLNGWQAGDDPREGVHPYSVIVGRSERNFGAAADGWGHGWPVVHHVRLCYDTDEWTKLTESSQFFVRILGLGRHSGRVSVGDRHHGHHRAGECAG
jgi:hypothetical protein